MRTKKRFAKKMLGVVSAAAMTVTSFAGIGAAAADSNIILENQTYNGGMQYIKTFMASEYAGKSAIKLTYEYKSLDADGTYVNDDGETKDVDYSDTFEFVAFDMSWGGWIPTGAGVDEGVTPDLNTQYTSTVSIDTIEASLGEGVSCQGFNFATGAIGDTQVKLIKMEYVDAVQTAAGAVFEGSWEKGEGGSFTRKSGDARISTNEWYIGITNLYVKGFKNPTIDVTVDYETAPNAYVQAEIQNGATGEAIVNNYPYVDKAGTVTYTTEFSDDLTSLNVCYDNCVVKKIRIYDNTEGDVTVSVTGKTATEIAEDMGIAWNLGNSLDAVDGAQTIKDENNADVPNPNYGKVSETCWGNPVTTKKLIQAVKAQGFKTIRIPVSFLDKIGSNNKVDRTYLARVKQVIDYAYDMGMYVVVDMHNDGGNGIATKWLDITKTDENGFTAIKTKFAAVWGDIATYFKNYDQKLVFEGFNELMNGDYNSNPTGDAVELKNINALNNAFVKAVRDAGGKNTDRVLIVAGYNTNIDVTVASFVKPTDKVDDTDVPNRLMLSVHYYSPYAFALQENMNTTTWGTSTERSEMKAQIDKISNFAAGIGMPVFIGEYGPIDKNNTEARGTYCYRLNDYAHHQENNTVVTAYWDNGVTKLYGSALFDRVNNTVTATGSEIIAQIKRGMEMQ